MNVVQRIGRAIGQTRHWSVRQVLLVACWLLALAIIEIRGRSSLSDLADAFALLELFFALIVSLVVDYESTTSAIARCFNWVRNRASALFAKRLLLGPDLRREPPLARAIPRRWLITLGTLIVVNLAALAGSAYLPVLPREWLHSRFYLGYLLLLFGVWLAMVVCIVFATILAWSVVHDFLISRHQGAGAYDRKAESICMRAGGVAIILGILILPSWTPWALLAALMVVWTMALLGYRDGFQLLWKRRDAERVQAVDGCFAMWLSGAVPISIVSLLLLLSHGAVLHASGPIAPEMLVMPITTGLGVVLAWTVTATMALRVATILQLCWLRRGLSARRQVLPVLHVEGELSRTERRELSAAALATGWRIRFAPRAARRTDVKVRFCQHLAEQEKTWPMPISLRSFASSQTQFRLARRHEIQSRRLVLHGLERIFKRAARLTDPAGTGYLIGIQHWFMLGLMRDKEPDFSQDRETSAIEMIVGPPFHAVMPLPARRHFQEILSALAIDVIFVEDGVSYRRLARAIRVAFEIYDIHGGQRRAEERDFHGLPGLRVMLHEVSMVETTHQVERGYPEPDYEEIGRARILHIFKDRGEEEAWEPLPWETDDVPLLSGH
jgi:hypothetical protein